jgi:hypothetical protein
VYDSSIVPRIIKFLGAENERLVIRTGEREKWGTVA